MKGANPSFPEMYEQHLVGPLFRPWAEIALDEVGLSSGDRLLDVACGTGIVARVARERLGESVYVVGVDVNPQMIAVAREVAPAIDWREGNAGGLPLHDGERFNVVVCHQGLQFFPDKAAAAVQMRGALAPGGRIAVATWRADDEMPFVRELRLVAERRLGPIADPRHSFPDAGALEALLRGAGFGNVGVRTMSRTTRFSDGAPFLRMNTTALIGMSALGKQMDQEERQRVASEIIAESAPVLHCFADGSGIAFELATNIATAES